MLSSNFRTPLDLLHEYSPRGLCKSSAGSGEISPSKRLKSYIQCCEALHREGCTSADSFDLLSAQSSVHFVSRGVVPNSSDEFDIVYQWGKYLKSIQIDIDGFYGADYNALIALARNYDSEPYEKECFVEDISNSMALLLACGARMDVRDSNGMQVLHSVFDDGYFHEPWFVEKKVTLLIQHSMRLAMLKERGLYSTAFDFAVLEQLLDSRDNFGRTPRDVAREYCLHRSYDNALRACGIPSNVLEMENGPIEWHSWFKDEQVHEEPLSSIEVPASASPLASIMKGKEDPSLQAEFCYKAPSYMRWRHREARYCEAELQWDDLASGMVMKDVTEMLHHPTWRIFVSLVFQSYIDGACSRLRTIWEFCWFIITWAGFCLIKLCDLAHAKARKHIGLQRTLYLDALVVLLFASSLYILTGV